MTQVPLVRTYVIDHDPVRRQHVALSPDGRFFACAAQGNNLHVRALPAGETVRVLAGLIRPESWAFTPESAAVVAVSKQALVCWDLESAAERFRLQWTEETYGLAQRFVFAKSGQTLVVGSGDEEGCAWLRTIDMQSGQQKSLVTLDEREVVQLLRTACGEVVACTMTYPPADSEGAEVEIRLR